MMASLPVALFFIILPCVSSSILGLSEGSSCTSLYGGKGRCSLLSRCPNPGDFKRENPPICSFRGKEPVICCPKIITEKIRYGALANQYCQRMKNRCTPLRRKRDDKAANGSTKSTEGGEIEISPNFKPPKQFVVGGKKSRPTSQKNMAIIGYGSAENKEWGCGGSLINSRFILSAAHCANPGFLGPAKWARLGDLDLSSTFDDANAQDREIVERILYPEYREPQVYHDIALFKLDRDVLFTDWVAPVCLNTVRSITADVATVTGWGRVDYAGATSSHLLEADLNVFSDSECRRLLPTVDDKTPKGIDSDLMFCAGKIDGSKDACSGDSGGPLVISKPDTCVKIQVGITSYGNQCGLPDSPGVYTRVSQYIPWIEGIVFANETTSF